MSKYREELAEVVSEVVSVHHVDSSDEQRVNGEWTWGLNCDCGEFVPDAEVDTHLADALLPVLARVVAEAKAEALREAAEAIESRDGRVDAGWLRTFGLRAALSAEASGREGER